MADGNPFANTMMSPRLAQQQLFDMRMMSSANRMESPFERGMRGMYGHQGVSGNPMLAQLAGMSNEPDYSQFTFDPAMRQQAIDLGVHPLEASQVKQNMILPNTGFFGRHSGLSGALEGGIFGALAAHGGATIGDSIQGTLEGLVGGKQMREGMYRQQFARPFEAAGMLEGLHDASQKRELQSAEIEHYRALNQKLGRPDHDFRTIGNAGPQDKFIPELDNTTGELKNISNPNYDPALVRQGQHASAWAGLGHLEPYAQARGFTDPSKMTPKDWSTVNKDYEDAQGRMAFGKGRGSTEGRTSVPGELTDEQKEKISGLKTEMGKLDSRETTTRLRTDVMTDPAWGGKPLNEINAEVEKRRSASRTQFQQQIDQISNPKQSITGKTWDPVTQSFK